MLPAFDNPVLDVDATPNTIALIGNGYDIHYGLNTKYSDFYDFLYNLNRFRDSSFENFKSEYLKSDYMIDRKLNYASCENVFNEWKYSVKNIFVNYFINLRYSDLTWANVEKELRRIIYFFDDIIANEMPTIDLEEIVYVVEYSKYPVTKFLLNGWPSNPLYNFVPKDDKVKIGFKIVDKGNDALSSEYIFERFCDTFPYRLLEELNLFEKLFFEYLSSFVAPDGKEHKKVFAEKIAGIISFNYTYPYDMEQNSMCKNIHGSISYDLANKAANQLIFGIESNRDFHNNNFRIFTKSIRRSVDANFDHSLNTYLCGVKKVIIYGHSLNEMDHNIIKHILEYAMDNYDKNRQQMHKNKFVWAFPFHIVLYYYDRISHFELASNLEIILGSERYNKMIANNQIEYICSKED